ncbi:MAG TPA: DUF533 domain-containing protein [Xanthomonadales bacterium]|nr:DUF533 domain-containing protein [Xanthomonadales bacterium]
MFDAERLLGQMMGGALGESLGGGRRRNKRGGSSLFGTAMRNPAATMGLIGIAIAAFEHFTQKTPATPGPVVAPLPATPPPAPTANSIPPPPPPGARRDDVLLLIRAMVAAAAADGTIDALEREAIEQRAASAGLDEAAREFLRECVTTPPTAAQIAAVTPPRLARDIYLASAIAITPDTKVEREYLDTLAAGLGLDAQTRASLDAEIAAP